MTEAEASSRKWWVDLVILLVASMAVMFVLSTIALVLYNNASRSSKTVVLEIPLGTSELIADGQNALQIPEPWIFQEEDTLLIDNRDDAAHDVGGLVAAPGESAETVLLAEDNGLAATSLLPSGEVDIEIELRHASAWILLYPTVGFGLSIGFVLWIGLKVVRSLDKEPDMSDYLDRSNTHT